MRKLGIVTLCLLAIYGLARAADVENPFRMPATTCTNQFIRSLATITGVGTCATVSLTADVANTLPIANGGTNDTGTAWTPATPTPTCIAGSGTLSGTTRIKTIGKTALFSISVTITAIGTCGTSVAIALPFTTANIGYACTISGKNVITPVGLIGGAAANTSSMTITTNANAFPGTTGDRLDLNGVCETT